MKKNRDALLLVIHEKTGKVCEYQRMLYEASLLGIEHVRYCLVYETEEEYERINEVYQKLEMTCEVFNMTSSNSVMSVYDNFEMKSKIIKVDEEDRLVSLISGIATFDEYKNNNSEMLNSKQNVGKVLAKQMAQKWLNVKVSSVNI